MEPLGIYFTMFNQQTFIRPESVAKLRYVAEMRMKYLLLLKGHLVIPVAHVLNSPVATSIFLDNTFLLNSGYLLLTIRDSTPTIDAMVAENLKLLGQEPDPSLVEHLRSCEDNLRVFQLAETEGRLRSRLIQDLQMKDSVLAGWLGDHRRVVEEAVVAAADGHLPHHLGIASKVFSEERKTLLRAYFDLLYYVVGSNEFGAECLLPQAEVPALFDIVAGSEGLSDDKVFQDIFLFILADVAKIRISKRFLELVDLRDIIDFRTSSETFKQFHAKLGALHSEVFSPRTLDSPDILVTELESLLHARLILENQYQKQLRRELAGKKAIDTTGRVSGLIIAATALLAPVVGLVSGLLSLAGSALNISGGSRKLDASMKLAQRRLVGSDLLPFAEELFAFQSERLPQILDDHDG